MPIRHVVVSRARGGCPSLVSAMEHGAFRSRRRPKRARPTEQEIQDLISLIGDPYPQDVTRKVAVVAPSSGIVRIRESLGEALRLSRGALPMKSLQLLRVSLR